MLNCSMPHLACDISQSLWDALNQTASQNGETISHLVSRALADTLQIEHGTLFQVSTSGALVKGVLDGVVSVETLREHGNFGLGTYADLDGEMIVVDGVFYRVRSDGSVHVEGGSSLSPFALVTHFNPETKSTLRPFATMDALCMHLDALRGSDNLFYAVRLRGTFSHLHNRAACKVGEDGTLVQAASLQGEFKSDGITGTMVGFWTPHYIKTVGVTGWHLHFISDDRSLGGHVLGAAGNAIEAEVEHLDDFRIALPETAEFLMSDLNFDPAPTLDKVEKSR
jgi:acetolactate decarboxylase